MVSQPLWAKEQAIEDLTPKTVSRVRAIPEHGEGAARNRYGQSGCADEDVGAITSKARDARINVKGTSNAQVNIAVGVDPGARHVLAAVVQSDR